MNLPSAPRAKQSYQTTCIQASCRICPTKRKKAQKLSGAIVCNRFESGMGAFVVTKPESGLSASGPIPDPNCNPLHCSNCCKHLNPLSARQHRSSLQCLTSISPRGRETRQSLFIHFISVSYMISKFFYVADFVAKLCRDFRASA